MQTGEAMETTGILDTMTMQMITELAGDDSGVSDALAWSVERLYKEQQQPGGALMLISL